MNSNSRPIDDVKSNNNKYSPNRLFPVVTNSFENEGEVKYATGYER